MGDARQPSIALIGKPNVGKSSLFNRLTGMRQKVGNYPGVTVERRKGWCALTAKIQARIIDLPGLYSLYPSSTDEQIATKTLLDDSLADFPNVVICVADATNLQPSLLLLSQLTDLRLPVVLVINMMDMLAASGRQINEQLLIQKLDIPVVCVSSRTGAGLKKLKALLGQPIKVSSVSMVKFDDVTTTLVERLQLDNPSYTFYQMYQRMQQGTMLDIGDEDEQKHVAKVTDEMAWQADKVRSNEIVQRYAFIQQLTNEVITKKAISRLDRVSTSIDRIVTHGIWGYPILIAVLWFVFQSIFTWAQPAMDGIDMFFSWLSTTLKTTLPNHAFFNLLIDGVLAGVGGVMVFVPQIALLFLYIAILEESGYMPRAVFLMDSTMRKFGMSGRSVIPLVSGFACAIPAIMATRGIENWKERLITIMVTPLMGCSARIPVYTIIIALVIPNEHYGIFNLQGIVLFALYLLGFFMALVSAWVIQKIVKSEEKSMLLMELPVYRIPQWRNVGMTMLIRVRSFVVGAGKIIIAVSVVLWVMFSYGPPSQQQQAEAKAQADLASGIITINELDAQRDAYYIEYSYAGILGKAIEPAIAPLGYDWKIGIALMASFIAREVFVGSMATIYGVGSTHQGTLKERLQQEKDPRTGQPRFTLALGLSLLVFYAFALQCASTLAVVKRETNSWKLPLIQMIYMGVLAYVSSWAAYQLAS